MQTLPMHYTQLTQAVSKCEKLVEMGKTLKFSKTKLTKPLYKSIALNFQKTLKQLKHFLASTG